MPVSLTNCGMMLNASPALSMVIDSTACSIGSTLRDTSVCSARISCAATTTGSTDLCGIAACPPAPSMVISNLSLAAMMPPARMPKLPERQARHVVHAIDLFDAEALHQPIVDHRLAAGPAFFGRLEDQHRGAIEIARLGEILGSPQQHRRVPVMPAGMHVARHRARIGLAGPLVDRQRIHVGAQTNGPARPTPPDHADNTGLADPGDDLVHPERSQQLFDLPRRAVNLVAELRVKVEIAAPSGDFIGEFRNAVNDGHNRPGMVKVILCRWGRGASTRLRA